jgi:O-antigen ligase
MKPCQRAGTSLAGPLDQTLQDPVGRPLPWPLWGAIFLAPVLGWFSAVCMLGFACWWCLRTGPRRAVYLAGEGAGRWLAAVALGWWLVLLGGDLLAGQRGAWWADFRFLLVILPALLLRPVLQQAAITHLQIGRWAAWSVWVTVAVIGLEYLITVQWLGMVHHRPRALSGNALFVSVMLVPMMLLCWLSTPSSQRRWWWRPLATYLAGIACLATLLGARTATLIAIALLPLPLLWLQRDRAWLQRLRPLTIAATALALVLVLTGPWMSGWYEQRWGALIQVLTGADPAALRDYGIASRAQHWPAAWQAFLERPWLGHGFLNETQVLGQHLPAGAPVLPTAHQQFLSFLLWSGLPGLVAGFLLIALPVLAAVSRQQGATAVYAAMALTAPTLLNGMTDTVFDDLRIVSYHLMMVVLLNSFVEAPATPGAPRAPT